MSTAKLRGDIGIYPQTFRKKKCPKCGRLISLRNGHDEENRAEVKCSKNMAVITLPTLWNKNQIATGRIAMTKPADSGQNVFKRLARWWESRNCEHVWRPAVKQVDQPTGYPFIVRRVSKPVRLCQKCEAVELLTQPEFYAQFGRMPW